MEDNKRMLPRHVDGRIKIGFIPILTFFKILPLYILILIFLFSNFTPFNMMFSVTLVGAITFIFSEFKNKESGMDMIKDMIRYAREGDIHFERSCTLRDEIKRVTVNEISKEGRKN